MWGLGEIKARNAEAAMQARAIRRKPYKLRNEDQLEGMPPFPFPMLGDAAEDLDKEHERVDTLFVDISGHGRSWEPALTRDQLLSELRGLVNEHGPLFLAFESVGAFQAHLGVWKEKAVRNEKRGEDDGEVESEVQAISEG